ncbi:TVP38/TMEM64 family protein [Jannaschia pagri]|uniref:TVP38/TMEM64 family membrane protein n=1 Tax=Jannaschia pagri TaxID=2829797 RepID=A0ABQ4NHF5_9RHOB|nr:MULTISPECIES: VTT domain-containing protein [unclassified Jannaschia]GIT90026.1 TVP38/TMEM64 family protein [Jannaschia sp. AI_61]GIT93868.1 TVP38/TMEM64 family protein [Jannaschia sp. AI_62]
MSDPTMTQAPKPKASLARYLPLAIVAIVAIAGAVTLRDYLSFQTLADNREQLIAFRDANYLLTALTFVGAYILIVAFSLPGAAIATLTGGFLFGLFPGVVFNAGAATIGATAIFLAAKFGLGDRLAAKMDASGGAVKKIKDGIREDETSYLFIMRLVPAVPFFVANLIPAFVGVSLPKYVLTTFFGILPGGLVYTWVGAGLGEVFAQGETPNFGIIFEPHILGPILGLAALALLPIVLKRFRKA